MKSKKDIEFDLIQLSDYCSYITDGTHGSHKNKEDGKFLLSAKDILDGNVIIKEDSRIISNEDFEKIHKNYNLEDGDVLLTVAGTIGRVGMIKNYKNNFAFQRSVAIFKNNDFDDAYWLYYYFNSPIGQNLINSYARGTTQLVLPLKELRNMEIPVPKDKIIQKRIIKILSTIDKKIEINKQINHNLELIAENIFKSWFVDCEPFDSEKFKETSWARVPNEWEEIELNDLINITSGKRPKEKLSVYTHEFKYPLFGASSIMAYVKEFLFNEKIIIIGRVGTHGVVQRVNCKSYPSDNTLVIKTDFYNYVYQILKRIDYDSLNIGSTQPLLTQKSIKKVEVILPPKKWLIKYEKICNILFSKIEKNNHEMIKLNNLKENLLPKLMSGELNVSNIKI